jgi:hypothetical protein
MVAGKKPKPLDPEAANDILDRMLSDEATPKARTTKTQQLKDLSPKVEALIAKGFTWDEITKALSKAGGVSKDTLRHAVRGKPQSKKKAAVASAPVRSAPKAGDDSLADKVAESHGQDIAKTTMDRLGGTR